MKKILIIIFIVSFMLAGCEARSTTTPKNITNSFEPSKNFEPFETFNTQDFNSDEVEFILDFSAFSELEPVSTNINSYRNEICKRINDSNDDQFLCDYESDLLQNVGFYISPHSIWISITDEEYAETAIYYYPVLYKFQNNLILWFTSEKGILMFRPIYGDASIITSYFGGPVHCDESDEEIIIGNYESFAISYNCSKGLVSQWQYGKSVSESNVPKDAVYCGESHVEGLLFRSGTDIYALIYGEKEAICIAHGVKFVIEPNYSFNSEALYQPLFLMEDGQILAYLGFESLGEAPDDPQHLVPPINEGGYR